MTHPRYARPLAAAALLAAACAIPVAAASGAGKTKTIKVGDDYFGPTKVTVDKGTTVKWSWLADNSDSHDVKLSSGPKGVKKFHSDSAATDFTFKRTLSKAGTYKIVCTLHQDMTMKITVRH